MYFNVLVESQCKMNKKERNPRNIQKLPTPKQYWGLFYGILLAFNFQFLLGSYFNRVAGLSYWFNFSIYYLKLQNSILWPMGHTVK